ncbi:MAG: MBL fold metallo-hydrolase [Phycisphaerales bacterium]|nr:MBL fold metallo-hydrolase [Phycisphaerales bacterium]
MITFSLQSGSNGNAIYVEAGDAKLLFDAGISGRQAALRMAAHGREISDCDALILSHEHADHTRAAGVYQRKFDLPIYCTERTFLETRRRIGKLGEPVHFSAGETLAFCDTRVHTIPTPHDGIDPVGFVVEHAGKKLGILTDLGHPFHGLRDVLSELDAMYLESNYDPEMLWSGTYPERLKRRISGHGGHLSNEEAAILVRDCIKPRFKWLAVAHLSEHNNNPELALDAQRKWVGRTLPVYLSSRYAVGEVLEV